MIVVLAFLLLFVGMVLLVFAYMEAQRNREIDELTQRISQLDRMVRLRLDEAD